MAAFGTLGIAGGIVKACSTLMTVRHKPAPQVIGIGFLLKKK